MNSPLWDKIFRLLAIVIVVDRKVFVEEIEAFIASVTALNKTIGDPSLRQNMIFDWYLQHRDSLMERVEANDVEVEIYALIPALNALPEKNRIIEAMRAISAADGHYHEREIAVVNLAARFWGEACPDFTLEA